MGFFMERHKIVSPLPTTTKTTTFLIIFFLLLSGMGESQFRGPPMPSRPLCLSQFALANHACSLLPYEPPPPSDQVLQLDSGSDGEGGDRDHQDRDHERHQRVHRHRLSHEERRRRRHHETTPIEEDCCRWLRAVDDQCVCQVLVHLPVFLARPWHRYEVVVDSLCNVTYDCAGRVIGF